MNVAELKAALEDVPDETVITVSTDHYDCFSDEVRVEDVVTTDGVQKIMIVGGLCK